MKGKGKREERETTITIEEVTVKDFAALAKRRCLTVIFLAKRFQGIIEQPKDYFERVLSCKSNGEFRGDVAIPYRSVREFYFQEMACH